MQAIYSIGQGGRSIEDLLVELIKRRIRFLCDVRSVPISNHAPDFCQAELRGHLARAGIAYVAMGDSLGGRPVDRSVYTPEGYVDYDKLVAADFFKAGIERLIKGSQDGHVMAVFCSEGEPERCHRCKAVGRALDEAGSLVLHIDVSGAELSQERVLARIPAPQISMLGAEIVDQRKLSRGRYAL